MDGQRIMTLSDLTLKEIENAPKKIKELIDKIPKSNIEYLILDLEAQELAQKYIDENAITKKYLIDAQHIALATIHKVDVLVSWNFKHIVNYHKIRLYNAVNLKYGYSLIEIRSPREIL